MGGRRRPAKNKVRNMFYSLIAVIIFIEISISSNFYNVGNARNSLRYRLIKIWYYNFTF